MMQTNAPISDPDDAVEAGKIAIVGLAGRFPGAQTIEQFWANLCAGVEARTTFTDETLAKQLAPEYWQDPAYVKAGFVLDQVDQFDADFFEFTRRQAQITDPQQRLFIECVWEALESAGIDVTQTDQQIGLYAGASQSTYATNDPVKQQGSMVESLPLLIGNDKDYLATQTAYRLNLQGPCMTIQSACSTGLVAVHVGSQSLLNYECDVAVAGAVTVRVPQGRGYLFEDGGILAVDGHCRAFDAGATGTVFGNGAGVVVLKRLSDALADGDLIWAVIRGSAVNNDGARKFNFTTSSPMGQFGVISEAWNVAGVTPAMITYVETHGTGTQVGDPIEVDTLASLFATAETDEKFCAIGSVKTNVGHLESAAGITGLIKTVLALHHRQIPPSLNYKTPNPKIDFSAMPLYVNTTLQAWETERLPRCAGVSSFGIGGTNAHLVLEEAPPHPSPPQEEGEAKRSCQLLTLSAKNEAALRDLVNRYAAFLANDAPGNFADICYTSHVGRAHFTHRLSVTAESPEQIREKLLAHGQGETVNGIHQNVLPSSPAAAKAAKVAFLFTGQGSQYLGMGRELYETEPTFRAVIDRCDAVLKTCLGRSLIELLYPATQPAHNDLMESHPCGQAANFALECALADLWRAWGVEPAVVLGHSLGDFAAAYTAGVLTLEEGLRLVTERGRLMETARGSMVSVLAAEAEVAPFLAAYTDVTIGVINGPRSVVISGSQATVALVTAQLQSAGFKTRKLEIPVAAHSPMLDPVLNAFEAAVRKIKLTKPQLPVVSSMTGKLVTDELATPAYWRKHLRNTVRFADGVQTLHEQGCTVFLEIGPKPTLLGMAQTILDYGDQGRGFTILDAAQSDTSSTIQNPKSKIVNPLMLPSLREGQSDWQQLLTALGGLYVQAVAIDWQGFEQHSGAPGERRKALLPTYPFQRQRYWIDAPKPTSSSALRPLIDKMIQSPAIKETIFETEFSVTALPFLAEHRVYGQVVSPGACQLAMVLSAAALRLQREQGLALADVLLPQALVLPAAGARTVQAIFTPVAANGSGPHYTFNLISFDAAALQEAEGGAASTHATGAVSSTKQTVPIESASAPDLAALRQRCAQPFDLAGFYTRLDAAQIALGPSFRWIRTLDRSAAPATPTAGMEAIAQLQCPEQLQSPNGYLLHPGLLDACFQVAGATRATENLQETLLPFALAGLEVHRAATGNRWWCHATQVGPYKWNLELLEQSGALVATLTGFEVRPAAAEAIQGKDAWRDWLYQVAWEPRPYFGLPPTYLPAPATVAPVLNTLRATLWTEQNGDRYQTMLTALEALSLEYGVGAFAKGGFTFQPGTQWRTEQIARQLGVVPSYRRLLERLLAILAEAEILQRDRDGWRVLKTPAPTDPAARQTALEAQYGNTPELTLLARCGERLSAVLRGVQEPLNLLFPGGDATVATQLYTESPGARVMNTLVQQVVQQAIAQLPAERGFRILEIGAGTGGTTASLLPLLPAAQTEYLFTDIGPAFLHKAQARFTDYPFVRYQPLDIEQTPAAQGFSHQQADLVIAANVLHATKDLTETLAHVRQLLQPGGQLVLVEGINRSRWVDLTFGLTEGWWRFADNRQDHPLLTAAQWQTLLAENGFEAVETIEQGGQAVIVAQVAPQGNPADGRTWLLFADRQGVAAALSEQLQQRGETPILVYAHQAYQPLDGQSVQIRPDCAEDYARLLATFPTVHGIVHLWSLDAPPLDGSADLVAAAQPGCGAVLHLVQALLQAHITPTGLWLVTHNAQAVHEADSVAGIAQAGLWGMHKSLALEHPELNSVCIDLGGVATPTAQAAYLYAELTAPRQTPPDAQIALRPTSRYVARLARLELPPSAALQCQPQATYLITGGLGGLGLATAAWLVGQGATHLVLMGRSQPTPAAHTKVEELRARGITVTVAQGDVTDRETVQGVLNQIDAAYPLRGIIYMAGVLDDGALVQQSWARFAKVLAPKIQGAWHLHELTQALPLDFFVLFSSTASLFGKRGQANHAAANALLDAFAHFRRRQGLPALALNWGGWSEIGAAAELIRKQQAALLNQGVGVIAPQQGLAALAALITQPLAQIGVAPMQWARYLQTEAAPSAFLANLAAQFMANKAQAAPLPTLQKTSNMRERLVNAAPEERASLLRTHVQHEVAQILGLAQLPALQVGFNEMGLDSLMAIELKNRLERALQVALPSTLAFEFPTVTDLATYILENSLAFAPDPPAPTASQTAHPPAVQPPGEATAPVLSSEDLLSFITQEFEQAFQ